MMFREMGEGTQLCKAINRCGRRKTREEKRRERTYIYIYMYINKAYVLHISTVIAFVLFPLLLCPFTGLVFFLLLPLRLS